MKSNSDKADQFNQVWDSAFSELRNLLPKLEYCTPDSILDNAERASLRIEQLDASQWIDFPDEELLRRLCVLLQDEHRILLVTDDAFAANASPFFFSRTNIKEFVTYHRGLTDSFIFSGLDIIAFSSTSRRLFVYHHEDYAYLVFAPDRSHALSSR